MSWNDIYNFLHIKGFIYFISSSQLQDYLFPVKLVFVVFAMFFLCAVIYFMINSSWMQYHFLEDVTEFFFWKSYGLRQISRRWSGIKKRIESESEADYKLAIIDADDFLLETLEDGGYEGENFEDSARKAARLLSGTIDDVLAAHETRNLIVFNPDFKISADQAKKILTTYETAVNSVGLG